VQVWINRCGSAQTRQALPDRSLQRLTTTLVKPREGDQEKRGEAAA
jgi:hypothetical protein